MTSPTVLLRNRREMATRFSRSRSHSVYADYDSLIEKKMLTPLDDTKQSREYADRLLSVHPDVYDAYLGPGVENYILSQKGAPVRFFLRLKGAQVDHDKGIDRLAKTAAHGYYLEPFAKLLLAVAALLTTNHTTPPGFCRNFISAFRTIRYTSVNLIASGCSG
jgi:hypothetical protein